MPCYFWKKSHDPSYLQGPPFQYFQKLGRSLTVPNLYSSGYISNLIIIVKKENKERKKVTFYMIYPDKTVLFCISSSCDLCSLEKGLLLHI